MDLRKSGELIRSLRKEKGLTQKQVAERVGVLPKTVSKWETGKGFPDVSAISALSEVLGISEAALLEGGAKLNRRDGGNIKNIKFYVCPKCGGFLYGLGECEVACCGKRLFSLEKQKARGEICISDVEDELYVEFEHEMSKEHHISFVAITSFDRVTVVKLYPEQEAAVYLPKVRRGMLYYYCTRHGLFEYGIK